MQQTRRLATGVSFLKFFLKRLFDIVGSLLIIMLLLPVILLALPILILQTKGSLLNVSKRVGRNYKIFDLYEFNCPPSVGDKKFWLKLNLTGLPQIINVLKGDLSLVGCYPISVLEAEKFTKDEIARRFSVPAGIFGLWRLNNSEEDGVKPQDSSDADIEYAMKNSMWLDIKILFCHLLNLVPAKSKQEYERAKVLTIGVN